MTTMEHWHQQNRRYLAAALTELRLHLQIQLQTWLAISETAPDTKVSLATLETEKAQALDAKTTLAQGDFPPAWILLCQRLGLSEGEQQLLWLCAALELDPAMASLCAQSQQQMGQANYPTLALAMQLFEAVGWESLLPDRPLRYWQLIDIYQAGAQPLVHCPLRIDERIVSYLHGLRVLDDRLDPFIYPLPLIEAAGPESQQALVTELAHRLRSVAVPSQGLWVHLIGLDAPSQQQLVSQVSQQLGLSPYHLSLPLLPKEADKLDTLMRLWEREAILSPVTLYVDAQELDQGATDGPSTAALALFLTRVRSLCFVGTRDGAMPWGHPTLRVDVSKPTLAEQQAAWEQYLGNAETGLAQQLAGQFHLTLPTIGAIAENSLAQNPAETTSDRSQQMWQACLSHTRQGLDALAQRIDPKATWADIVLPDKELALLHQLTDQVQYRSQVYQAWGFDRKMNRGKGITALFAGASGTGKTMAAEVIANALELNLYRIDLSAVVSKYIGETEKNLCRLFDAAESGGTILLFDEADALFGKRSEVQDSHDRYANIEINYLLQRMEAYQGLALLATNCKSALDTAFGRRLRFVINFPFPSIAERQVLWQQMFPAQTPTDGLDFPRLAQFVLTGGSIQNIALNGAFLAARLGQPVTMPLLFEAIRTELEKLELPINETQFAWSRIAAGGNGHRPVGSTQAYL